MNVIEIIEKARDKNKLTSQELDYFAKGVANKSISDYHIAAFTMAVYLNGLSNKNIIDLTRAYINSGNQIVWKKQYDRKIVDKHSTGGVGDKVSLALIPILAALKLKSAKLSGKGLGQTGGTIDKLHSIEGFKTAVSETRFRNLVLKYGMAIVEANKNMAPADKRIYAIRDVTGTVDSIPLIAASIMSKKIAGGSKNILIDLKVGTGAFTKNLMQAMKLVKHMKNIAKAFDKNFTVVLSNMYQPLGFAIGNAIEIEEVIEVLNGYGPSDTTDLVVALAAEELLLTKKAKNVKDAKKQIWDVIKSKKALDKFYELIKNQGGDVSQLKDLAKFTKAKYNIKVKSKKTGYIKSFDTAKLGLIAKDLGAGREKVNDEIDYKAGIFSYFKIGYKIKKEDVIYHLQSSKPIPKHVLETIDKTFIVSKAKVIKPKLIYKIIR